MTLNKINQITKKIILFAAMFAANIFCISGVCAQEIAVTIKVTAIDNAAPAIRVTGKILNPNSALRSRDISFLRDYADVSELGERIENLKFFGGNGERISVKQLIAGEFQTAQDWTAFEYEVKINSASYSTAVAHVSSLAGDGGLLMLNDLLPQWKSKEPVSARVTLDLPAGWKILTTETANNANSFDVKNIEKGIFLVGINWRVKTVAIDKSELNLATAGEWMFSDDEALEMATSILAEYRKLFGALPGASKIQINVLPFARKTSQPDRWRAETRGSMVTVISGAITLKSQAIQRLLEQLRHEIFHLWMPNALNLSGNYDWFYEGFTVYQALRTGVELNQIRFEDYLKTLGNAFDLAQNQKISLVEMSNRRWMGGENNSVYGKGMIAAFLCDAALVRESRGKRSLANIFRLIFDKHKFPYPVQEANPAILANLKSFPELRAVVENYIEGTSPIDWETELRAFGIEAVKGEAGTVLKVAANPGGRQKDLLDKLGYNQWRRLGRKT
jgi:predicted metalloprotease with PDZ domain